VLVARAGAPDSPLSCGEELRGLLDVLRRAPPAALRRRSPAYFIYRRCAAGELDAAALVQQLLLLQLRQT